MWFGNQAKISHIHTCSTVTELIAVTNHIADFVILGNGSNMLFHNPVEHVIRPRLTQMYLLDDRTIYAQSGVKAGVLARFAADHGISGLEFCGTIPGTVGGMIKMNAGAFGCEMKDIVQTVEILRNGQIANLSISTDDDNAADVHGFCTEEHVAFGYRQSNITDLVIGGIFRGIPASQEYIFDIMQQQNSKRIATQPMGFRTLGSTFKNPKPLFAGKLLEECALQGYTIGGARFSSKHANFIENFNHATSADVLALIHHAQQQVLTHTGITLELEIKIV